MTDLFSAESENERQSLASTLVDWYRLAPKPLPPDQTTQLISAVERVHQPTLGAFFECIRPYWHCLWNILDVPTRFSELRDEYVLYLFPLIHSNAVQVEI